MAYRQTEKVARRLAARREAILDAACNILTKDGAASIQIANVADHAGIAAGTIYRYFPSKTELVAAVVSAISEQEIAELEQAAVAAPGPLSALTAAIVVFGVRALRRRRLMLALMAQPAEPELNVALMSFRRGVAAAFERLIQKALEGSHLRQADAALAAPALLGALTEGLIGSLAPASTHESIRARDQVQTITLFALRALGVGDAQARGLIIQALMSEHLDRCVI